MIKYNKSCSYFLIAIVLSFSASSAPAADLREVTVGLENDHYFLRSVAWLDATQEDLYQVLTNYDLFVHISSGFVESRNIAPSKEGAPRFYTRMQGCVLVFCKSFERYGHLELNPLSEIIAITIANPDPIVNRSAEVDYGDNLSRPDGAAVALRAAELATDLARDDRHPLAPGS